MFFVEPSEEVRASKNKCMVKELNFNPNPNDLRSSWLVSYGGPLLFFNPSIIVPG
jgi:hypothetical protein